jgi:hypothetical protein
VHVAVALDGTGWQVFDALGCVPWGNARAGSFARLASRAEDEFQLRWISYRPKSFR